MLQQQKDIFRVFASFAFRLKRFDLFKISGCEFTKN